MKIKKRYLLLAQIILCYSYTLAQPIRSWATYFGGNYMNEGSSVAVDRWGNVYIAGRTDSSLITTPGCHQPVYGGTYDSFLAKFNSLGMLQWSTYYGGSGWETQASVTTDSSGNIYISGLTSSPSGISSPGAHQTSWGGNYDMFIAKFNPSGVRQWGTYLGGVGDDVGHRICSDKSGNVYIGGYTFSPNNISTPGSYQPIYAGNYDAFIEKFNSAGVRQWGSYYGDTIIDSGESIAIDELGNVYMSGLTGSSCTTGISTPGSHQPLPGGLNDAFIVKFDSLGNRIWGTYYGGTQDEQFTSIDADSVGNLYLLGATYSTTGISTPGTFQPIIGPSQNVFIVSFNANGVRQWGSYFDDGGVQFPNSIIADNMGNSYFAGTTGFSSIVSTSGAHQTAYGGGISDGFFQKFDNTGNRIWGSYYGGTEADEILSMAVNKNSHNLYLSGLTWSTTGIATSASYQPTFGGLDDAFVVKFGSNLNIGIEEKNLPATINIDLIYPSFATDEINVLLYSEEQTKSTVSIFDLLGQLVWTNNFSLQQGQSELKIPVAQLSSGNYILSISVPLGNSTQRKFVK